MKTNRKMKNLKSICVRAIKSRLGHLTNLKNADRTFIQEFLIMKPLSC